MLSLKGASQAVCQWCINRKRKKVTKQSTAGTGTTSYLTLCPKRPTQCWHLVGGLQQMVERIDECTNL